MSTTSDTSSLTIAVGADHAGYELKDEVAVWLHNAGFTVLDLGTWAPESVDYPDFAAAVGRSIQDGRAWRGVVVCGSGAGACIAANKMQGIRAALCHDTYSAHQSVEHDDANVLCMGSRIIGSALAEEIVLAFVAARFSGEERHLRRLNKVNALEAESADNAHGVSQGVTSS